MALKTLALKKTPAAARPEFFHFVENAPIGWCGVRAGFFRAFRETSAKNYRYMRR
jgi:hypothetical protein